MIRWISVGSDLKFDARRDLDDMGAMCIEGNIQLLHYLYFLESNHLGSGIKGPHLEQTAQKIDAGWTQLKLLPKARLKYSQF